MTPTKLTLIGCAIVFVFWLWRMAIDEHRDGRGD